jgi:hypothetical protein
LSKCPRREQNGWNLISSANSPVVLRFGLRHIAAGLVDGYHRRQRHNWAGVSVNKFERMKTIAAVGILTKVRYERFFLVILVNVPQCKH